MKPIKQTVAVGMSGGVDSTATAYLLMQQGYSVYGVTMHLFDVEDSKGRLTQPTFIDDAKKMCDLLGINHYVIDLRDAFKQTIMNDFVEKYRMGITPNPCVLCNKTIKYGLFMDAALSHGADFFATGHYARIMKMPVTGEYGLFKGLTHRKDQAYFLHQLPKNKLNKLILPLGGYANKSEIRAIASKFNQYISEKKDSQGICFVQGAEYHRFIEAELNSINSNGMVKNKAGEIIGEHDGYYKYTIGQKRGFVIYNKQNGAITGIDAKSNVLTFESEEFCYHTKLKAVNVNWLVPEDQVNLTIQTVRICQWGYDLKAEITITDEHEMEVHFAEPVRAIAPGQYAVVYDGDRILGGGLILKAYD